MEVSDPETVVIREELVYVRVSFAREALTDGRNPHLCTRAAGSDCRDEDTVDELVLRGAGHVQVCLLPQLCRRRRACRLSCR